MQRTDWAELFVERFTAIPLTAECVYRSPRYLPADKELCDHMILLRHEGMLVSLVLNTGAYSINFLIVRTSVSVGNLDSTTRASE